VIFPEGTGFHQNIPYALPERILKIDFQLPLEVADYLQLILLHGK